MAWILVTATVVIKLILFPRCTLRPESEGNSLVTSLIINASIRSGMLQGVEKGAVVVASAAAGHEAWRANRRREERSITWSRS